MYDNDLDDLINDISNANKGGANNNQHVNTFKYEIPTQTKAGSNDGMKMGGNQTRCFTLFMGGSSLPDG
jgi:hypothetical protein